MTADELKAIVRAAVREELSAVGMRVDEPEHQDEVREDLRFIRKMRKAFDGAASKIGYTILTALAGGVIWLMVQGANFWKAS